LDSNIYRWYIIFYNVISFIYSYEKYYINNNFFAASGYVVGGILGISAGMIILIKKYFEYIGHSSFRDKERDFLIEVDLT